MVGNFLCVVFEQDGGPRNTVGRREIAAVKEEKISGPHFGVTVSFRCADLLSSLPTCCGARVLLRGPRRLQFFPSSVQLTSNVASRRSMELNTKHACLPITVDLATGQRGALLESTL